MSSANNNVVVAVEKRKGRKKTANKKIENEQNLLVTFSKRRSGIFKKGSELCTLCNADVAIVVFSPAGKNVFSFGSPSVYDVLDRYVRQLPPLIQNANAQQSVEVGQRVDNEHALNLQLTRISNQLEAEKIRNKELGNLAKIAQTQFWWASPIETMNLNQLNLFKSSLQQLKKCVLDDLHKLFICGAINSNTNNYNYNYNNSLGFLPGVFSSNFVAGSSSSNLTNSLAMPQQPMMGNGVLDRTMMDDPLRNNVGGYGTACDGAGGL